MVMEEEEKENYEIINKENISENIINVKFKVIKVKQNDNYSYYEGYNSNKKLIRYIAIKHNQNGYNGQWFQFNLTNGKQEYVKGPWYDFSRDFI
tara:strand:- start:409 stop:690 length:282 start_codon:yes stop_codon:yes gene_type:complete